MSDIKSSRPPAIAKARFDRGSIALDVVVPGAVIELVGALGHDVSLSLDDRDVSLSLGDGERPFLRAAGPGRWFLVLDRPLSPAALGGLSSRLNGVAYVVDQSHGRVRFRLSGADVCRVLAKGTGVDLDHPAFPAGTATFTLFGHIGIHLTRISDDGFELLVQRSFAQSLAHDLARCSAEFGRAS